MQCAVRSHGFEFQIRCNYLSIEVDELTEQ